MERAKRSTGIVRCVSVCRDYARGFRRQPFQPAVTSPRNDGGGLCRQNTEDQIVRPNTSARGFRMNGRYRTPPIERITACRSCGSNDLVPIIDFGATPLADRLLTAAE